MKNNTCECSNIYCPICGGNCSNGIKYIVYPLHPEFGDIPESGIHTCEDCAMIALDSGNYEIQSTRNEFTR